MKKRIYALALCLLLLAAFPLTAFADGEGAQTAPELTISTVREGEKLTVTVGIENNPGIAGFDVSLSYDSDALGAPAVTVNEAWPENMTVTDCAPGASGGTVKVTCVRTGNFEGDAALYSVTFDASELLLVNLTAQGTACAWDESEVALASAEATVAADVLRVSAESAAGTVTATVASYGSGYSGEAKAILTCYQGGKFVGCVIKDITIGQNGETNVAFTGVSLSGDAFRLLLTNANFVPLTEPVVLPAGK